MSNVTVLPLDEYNRQLVDSVHPADWVNPQPETRYDLVVIGAGTAGLVVAAGAAGLGIGLKVALVERRLMGGDCLNYGCIPSKAMIRSSRVVGEMLDAGAFGIHPPERLDIDFPAVMARMRKLRAGISHVDSAQRFASLGVDVFFGEARFASDHVVAVDNSVLRYKKAVIATGARASRPEIAGIETVEYYTNETIFSLTARPPRLAIIGGGPIGCELAQAFHRLGSAVILVHNSDRLLNKEDPEAAALIQHKFSRSGIQLLLDTKIERLENSDAGKILHYVSDDETRSITVDAILVSAGRVPNVEGLNLEAVGVEFDPRHGVKVNDYLQTTNPKIYAAGDICMNWKFTHAADASARIVIKNTLFSPFGLSRTKLSSLVMPWVTYTDPEIAHVGLSAAAAKEQGLDVQTIEIEMSDVDRAIVDGEETGFLKIIHLKDRDRIVGATIVASHAGEMISEITTAIVNKIGLGKLASTIHPYPTQAEAIKKAADAYRRTLLTPNNQKLLGLLSKLS